MVTSPKMYLVTSLKIEKKSASPIDLEQSCYLLPQSGYLMIFPCLARVVAEKRGFVINYSPFPCIIKGPLLIVFRLTMLLITQLEQGKSVEHNETRVKSVFADTEIIEGASITEK